MYCPINFQSSRIFLLPGAQALLRLPQHRESAEALLPRRGHRQRPHLAPVRRPLHQLLQGIQKNHSAFAIIDAFFSICFHTRQILLWKEIPILSHSCLGQGPHPLYKPTKDKLVPCGHPICNSLPAAAADAAHGEGWRSGCKSPKDQCDYEVEYADHGSSRGVLIRDAFSIRFVNGSLLRPHLVFGYRKKPPPSSSPCNRAH